MVEGYNKSRSGRSDRPETIGASNHSNAVQILTALDYQEVTKFASAAEEYMTSENPNEIPKFPYRYLDEPCRLFTAIFGIETYIDKGDGRFLCKSQYSDEPYTSRHLSSGEQWALRVLPEFIALKDRDMYVVVDEPETFLNEALSVAFWSKIEQERPHWSFIYATHNVSFATRIGIDKVVFLKSISEPPQEIDGLADIPTDDKRKLFSVGPELIRSTVTLVVEGTETSSDESFYRAILDDKTIQVTSIGNCHDVQRMVEKDDIWSKLDLSDIMIRGVIDRDYRSDEFAADFIRPEITALALHDLEAYLCIPEFLEKAARAVEDHEQNRLFYEEQIIQHAIDNKTRTIISFLNNTFKVGGPVSISYSYNTQWDTPSIIAAYCDVGNRMTGEIENTVNDTKIRLELNKIERMIGNAINERNIIALLRIFKGKRLFQELRSSASLENESHAVRLIAKKRLADDIDQFSELKTSLQKLLAKCPRVSCNTT